MPKDRIASAARSARAALKQALGVVTGDRALEAEGAAEKAAARPGRDGTRGPVDTIGTRDAR